MSLEKSIREFFEGLQNIEKKIRIDLQNKGIVITDKDLLWNHGKEINPTQDGIELVVNNGQKSITIQFNREQLEDSWQQITRSDVRASIQHIIYKLSK